MKRRGIDARPRRNAAHSAPIGARPSRTPAVARHGPILHEPLMCEHCGAVYKKKTWRGGERTRRTSLLGVSWTLCPACAQVRDQEYFGRVRLTAPLEPQLESEVLRRIWNVERRARYTQPERRTVLIGRRSSGLEILTTSQKLAHRIARELAKAFGGRAHYVWTDREGALDSKWEPPAATEEATDSRSANGERRW